MQHEATGIRASTCSFLCMEEAYPVRLDTFVGVGHIALLAPQEVPTRISGATVNRCGFRYMLGWDGGWHDGSLPGCVHSWLGFHCNSFKAFFGMLGLVVGNEEALGRGICTRDDLGELVDGVLKQGESVNILRRVDACMVLVENMVQPDRVGNAMGEQDGHLIHNRCQPKKSTGRVPGVHFEEMTGFTPSDHIAKGMEHAEKRGLDESAKASLPGPHVHS